MVPIPVFISDPPAGGSRGVRTPLDLRFKSRTPLAGPPWILKVRVPKVGFSFKFVQKTTQILIVEVLNANFFACGALIVTFRYKIYQNH